MILDLKASRDCLVIDRLKHIAKTNSERLVFTTDVGDHLTDFAMWEGAVKDTLEVFDELRSVEDKTNLFL